MKNTLLNRPLEFGDVDQIKVLKAIQEVLEKGYPLDNECEYFNCFKCGALLGYSRELSCDYCGNIEDEDDHEDTCSEKMEILIPEQSVKCSRCKIHYDIVVTDDYYNESTVYINQSDSRIK